MARVSKLKLIVDHHKLKVSLLASVAGIDEEKLESLINDPHTVPNLFRPHVAKIENLYAHLQERVGIISFDGVGRPNINQGELFDFLSESEVHNFKKQLEAGKLKKMEVRINGTPSVIVVPDGLDIETATARETVRLYHGHVHSTGGDLRRAELLEKLAREKWEDCEVKTRRAREHYESHKAVVEDALTRCGDEDDIAAERDRFRGYPGF